MAEWCGLQYVRHFYDRDGEQADGGVETAAHNDQQVNVHRNKYDTLAKMNSVLSTDSRTDVLPVQGVRAITYITTIPDKQLVLTLLCSLLNTVSRAQC